MIGILDFKQGIIFAGALMGILHADNLTLVDDTRLTGTVRSINESGVVELASAISPEPILLKSGGVTKVEFDAPRSPPAPLGTWIELTNGDQFPVSLEGLDDENLKVVTADAGALSIPRTALKSMQLGPRERKIFYHGPGNLAEWSHEGGGMKNWTFIDQSLVANGSASIAKHFETPSQFTIKLTLKWQATPSFQIYFADPLKQNVELQDRYDLQFNDAGLEVKRESSQGKHFQTIISLNRTPDQFPAKQVKLEIRVDRKTSRLHLYLDGEPEGAGVDPVSAPPVGNGIRLVSNSPAGTTQEIREIEISELDLAGARHRSENRGDTKTDSMISRDDDRWSGHLTEVKKGSEGSVFTFKSDFQNEPLELGENDISVIFFAHEKDANLPKPVQSLALRLPGQGMLTVTSCVFSASTVTAVHPLLGTLTMNRSGIASLQRIEPNPSKKLKNKPEVNVVE